MTAVCPSFSDLFIGTALGGDGNLGGVGGALAGALGGGTAGAAAGNALENLVSGKKESLVLTS